MFQKCPNHITNKCQKCMQNVRKTYGFHYDSFGRSATKRSGQTPETQLRYVGTRKNRKNNVSDLILPSGDRKSGLEDVLRHLEEKKYFRPRTEISTEIRPRATPRIRTGFLKGSSTWTSRNPIRAMIFQDLSYNLMIS